MSTVEVVGHLDSHGGLRPSLGLIPRVGSSHGATVAGFGYVSGSVHSGHNWGASAGSAESARDVPRVTDRRAEVRDIRLSGPTRTVEAEEDSAEEEDFTVVEVADRAAAAGVGVTAAAEEVGDMLVASPFLPGASASAGASPFFALSAVSQLTNDFSQASRFGVEFRFSECPTLRGLCEGWDSFHLLSVSKNLKRSHRSIRSSGPIPAKLLAGIDLRLLCRAAHSSARSGAFEVIKHLSAFVA